MCVSFLFLSMLLFQQKRLIFMLAVGSKAGARNTVEGETARRKVKNDFFVISTYGGGEGMVKGLRNGDE